MHKEIFTINASHPRSHPRSTNKANDRLQCCGNIYSRSAILPASGTFNIIMAHANGFPKELYEPFIEDLFKENKQVKQVYILDAAHQNMSGNLNIDKLGDVVTWYDGAFDLFEMIRALKVDGPLIGIGHSMGGCQIAYLAVIHPRLFEGIVLMDPILFDAGSNKSSWVGKPNNIANMSARRRQDFPSRQAARQGFLKSPFYQSWEPKVFEMWMQYGVVPVSPPSAVSDNAAEEGPVRLSTLVSQEVYTFLHWFPKRPSEMSGNHLDMTDADVDCATFTFRNLAQIRCPVKFIYGERSPDMTAEVRLGQTSRCKHSIEHIMPRAGHLIPMEQPLNCALSCSGFLNTQAKVWAAFVRQDNNIKRESLKLTEEYKQKMADIFGGVPVSAKRAKKAKL
ncbi:Alpha/beta hydrolase family-domain-containing protein [Protomyces lactucae-debilis]|uniref:Alpha/beta hydrolase family-domain-containing protein n=1 Tax=Protomyces lactucae-debilis TaxID=2754530 RepID=A0A1Y2EW10_PROLT|nr:Alpha/beta hydrolase family-domain-containing protein [Protomyces lactucae-debilis]ORY75454.1 Alpha/beta hydrolase family-domain-containing protein [Protomyces lactucae-debilis]